MHHVPCRADQPHEWLALARLFTHRKRSISSVSSALMRTSRHGILLVSLCLPPSVFLTYRCGTM